MKTPLSIMWGLAYSPDGRTLAAWGVNTAMSQYELILLDVEKNTILKTIDIGPYQEKAGLMPHSIAFTPDGICIVAITSVEVIIFAVQ
jgi:hypothetical protein